jgi:DNA polymerase III alpha subunit
LAKCGALDCFGYDRMTLLNNTENLLNFHRHMQQSVATKQTSLFGAEDTVGGGLKVKLEESAPATLEDKLGWEKELLGFYLSSHPFKKFIEVYGDVFTPLDEVMGLPRSSWVIAGGIVESVKKKITKSGKVMLFVTLEDLTGPSEMLVFPKTYEKTQALWVVGAPLAIVGKVPEEEGDSKLFVERAYALQLSNPQAMRMELGLPAGGGTPGYATGGNNSTTHSAIVNEKRLVVTTAVGAQVDGNKLRELLKKYPGNYRVVIASKETGKKLVTSFYAHPHEELLAGLGEMFGRENVTLES